MKPFSAIAFLLSCFTLLADDIIITNVTKSATVPPGSYGLGTTGLVTRLLPMDLFPQLGASQTFTGSNNFTGGLAVNGVPVVTNATGGSQVWTNDGLYIWPANYVVPDPDGESYGPPFLFSTNAGIIFGANAGQDIDFSGAVLNSPASVSFVKSNDPPRIKAVWNVVDDVNYGYQAYCTIEANATDSGNPFSILDLLTVSTNGNSYDLKLNLQGANSKIDFSTNSVTVFLVDVNGTVTANLLKSRSTNGIILPCPGGGSFILSVNNDGTLNVHTNTGGL